MYAVHPQAFNQCRGAEEQGSSNLKAEEDGIAKIRS